MEIDFIKWMCEKAEGFSNKELTEYHKSFNDGGFSINVPLPNTFLESWCNHFETDFWRYLYYPLLLQRAMNDEYKLFRYTVIPVYYNEEWEVNLYDFDDMHLIKCSTGKTYDNAMENALRYIYEQERKS